MARKDELGRRGEDAAARYLERYGWQVLDRNWRCPAGELDIVAHDRRELVVVEVKTRISDDYGHPFEAIDRRKIARLWRIAWAWCAANPQIAHGHTVRIDALGLVGAGPFRVEYLRDLR